MRRILIFIMAVLLVTAMSGCSLPNNKSAGTDDPATSSQTSSGTGGTQAEKFKNKIDLSLDKTRYDQAERIEVTMNFADVDQDNAVIAIVSSDLPHGGLTLAEENTEEYRWIADFSEIPFYLWAPEKDGLFDARVYASGNGEELACVTFTVGNATLPNTSESTSGNTSGNGGKGGILTESGDCTQKQMEDTIVSYFASISNLSTLHLCNGSSIAYSKADIPWQTVDSWVINDPEITYDELASLMSSQLIAAGFAEENMSIGGYKWSIAVGDKAMRIELRPEDWAEGGYEIYATPEAE